jgi:hypothetical protein
MIVRRLLIALAVLIALTALAAGVAPRDRAAPDPGPQQTSPGQVSGESVERTLSTRARDGERRISVASGEQLRLTVEGNEVDSVQLGELEVAPIDPESPAVFELLADDPGSYPIRLLEADRTIGTLVVTGEPGA